MTMKVMAKINPIITLTTPPTMATVLSAVSRVVSVVVLSEVGWVVSGHWGSPNEVMATGQVSIFTRTPCTATGVFVLIHC